MGGGEPQLQKKRGKYIFLEASDSNE